jgi:hypothetical protein
MKEGKSAHHHAHSRAHLHRLSVHIESLLWIATRLLPGSGTHNDGIGGDKQICVR